MQIAPRARQDGMIAQPLDDDVVVYEVETGTAHRLNAAAAKVWRLADGTRSVAEIAIMSGLTERAVSAALGQLRRAGLLLTTATVSRRWVLRRGTIVDAA